MALAALARALPVRLAGAEADEFAEDLILRAGRRLACYFAGPLCSRCSTASGDE